MIAGQNGHTQAKVMPDANSQAQSQEQIVKYYLRKPNRQTIIVYGVARMLGKQLLALAESKMGIPYGNIVLFLQGQRIGSTGEQLDQQLHIENGDIVHVHNIANTHRKQINIVLKSFQCSVQMEESRHISVRPDHKIGSSLEGALFLTAEIALVQSGRKLDLDRTFEQQCIEDESIIVVTTFCRKQRAPAAKLAEKIQSPRTGRAKPHEYEDILNANGMPKTTLRKSATWCIESCDLNINQLSFKKKKKPSIYKSMKIPQSKEIIWESDGSGDLNKNLIKKIPVKKHRRQHSEAQQRQKIEEVKQEQDNIIYSDQQNSQGDHAEKANMFSSQDRLDLKNQLSRLLFSDSFEMKQSVSKLQPPQMLDDDFLEETEEIQMRPEQDDHSDEEEEREFPRPEEVKSSMNLRQSIGKSRGQFVLPLMIPTRDFGLDKEDSDSDEE